MRILLQNTRKRTNLLYLSGGPAKAKKAPLAKQTTLFGLPPKEDAKKSGKPSKKSTTREVDSQAETQIVGGEDGDGDIAMQEHEQDEESTLSAAVSQDISQEQESGATTLASTTQLEV